MQVEYEKFRKVAKEANKKLSAKDARIKELNNLISKTGSYIRTKRTEYANLRDTKRVRR